MTPSRRLWLLLAGLLVVAAVGIGLFFLLRPTTLLDTGPLDLPGVPDPPEAGEEVLLAVGDIGACDQEADDRVAQLADSLPGTIALLGDLAYPEARAEVLEDCFDPAWGPLLDRIRPTPGNHDYVDGSAEDYFAYFGEAAGLPGQAWYSYDLGDWHVVALDSNVCEDEGEDEDGDGCGPGSVQHDWLVDDLADADAQCVVAYWHHPRLSSGRHGSQPQVQPMWDTLVEAGVDVVLNGHDHTYERLEADGVTQFVVGTGGRSLYLWENDPLPETVARHDQNYGLLYLVLGEGSFRWEFLPLGSTTFTDSGEGDCG